MDVVQQTIPIIDNKQPICSICIANYNGLNIIKDCIDSILRQTCHFQYEIIIHDDGSSDNSVNFIKKHFPQVILIESKRNVGFCISNNRMVEQAQGEYILLLNNDATLFPNSLQTLYEFAIKQETNGILGLPQYDMKSNQLIDRGSFLDPFLNPLPNLHDANKDVAQIIGACLWIPRKLWKELGGFPEWFTTNAEDMYICCYARLAGYPVIALNSSGFNHSVGKSLGGGKVSENKLYTSTRRRAFSERNKTYVMLLFYPISVLIFIFPLHIILLTVEGIILSLTKRNLNLWKKIYWFCFCETWSNKKRIIKSRKNIQSKKKSSNKKFLSVHTVFPHKLTLLLKYGLPEFK